MQLLFLQKAERVVVFCSFLQFVTCSLQLVICSLPLRLSLFGCLFWFLVAGSSVVAFSLLFFLCATLYSFGLLLYCSDCLLWGVCSIKQGSFCAFFLLFCSLYSFKDVKIGCKWLCCIVLSLFKARENRIFCLCLYNWSIFAIYLKFLLLQGGFQSCLGL